MADETTQRRALSPASWIRDTAPRVSSLTSQVLNEGVDIFPFSIGEQEVRDPGGKHPELLECIRETLHLAGMADSVRHGEDSFLVPADKRVVELLMESAVALYGALLHLIC